MSDICTHMSLQHTTLLGFLAVLLISCAGATTQQSETSSANTLSPDRVLERLGAEIRTLKIEGTLATTGEKSFDGMPFSAELDEDDWFRLTMSGPFGITAAKMVATRDSFRMVNYLLQEVWEGDPLSPTLKASMHLPIEAGALMSLLRGRVPDGESVFERQPAREDGLALFMRTDAAGIEYLLVDQNSLVIKQFQRKSLEGERLLDVAFSNIKTVDGIELPHLIFISSNSGESTATITVDDATANKQVDSSDQLKAPSSFSRKTFRR